MYFQINLAYNLFIDFEDNIRQFTTPQHINSCEKINFYTICRKLYKSYKSLDSVIENSNHSLI